MRIFNRGDRQEHIGQIKSGYKNIFSAPRSSRPLIGTPDTTLELQEHGANSELSGVPIRVLKKKSLFVW